MAENISAAGSSFSQTQPSAKRIFCVVSKDYENLTELQERQLKNAYTLLKQHDAKVAIASVEKVMATTKRYAGFSYIIPEFSGKLYEHLLSLNARIYGPLAIVQSLNKDGKIALYPKPLFAMYCVGFNVTVTGLTLEERHDIYNMIEALGGVTSGSFTQRTTHLFARSCDPYSEKYLKASKDKIPIISPEWVRFAYGAAEEGTVSINNEIPLNDYIIDIFTGCNMTPSGFNGEQRFKICSLVRQHGGKFSGSMVQKICTHLIIDSNTGEKYRKAVEWKNVKIVTLRWLMKCVQRGVRLPEDDYKPGVKTSTQTDFNRTLEAPDVSDVFSTTKKSRHPPPASVSSSNASIVAGDHTMMNPRNNATATAIIGSQTTPLKLPFSTFTKRNPSFAHSSNISTKVNDPVMDFDVSFFDDFGEYLKDCRLFFFEVADEQRYRRIANCTGCSIVDTLSSATHIIVPPRNYSHGHVLQLREAVERDAEVVSSEWLIECVQQQKNVDTEAYTFSLPRDRSLRNSIFGLQRKRGSSLNQEFQVSQHILDAMDPACDLSSMHNTRSFEARIEEVDNGMIRNNEQEAEMENVEKGSGANIEQQHQDFDNGEVAHEDQMQDFDDIGEIEQENHMPDVNMEIGVQEDPTQDVDNAEIEQEDPVQDADNAETEQEDPIQDMDISNGVQEEENIQKPSNAAGNNDCLNLSMPINEYISGNRPVTLHYPFSEMIDAISEDSELESPTLDISTLKKALAQMVKNVGTPDEYDPFAPTATSATVTKDVNQPAQPHRECNIAGLTPLSSRRESLHNAILTLEMLESSGASKNVNGLLKETTVAAPKPIPQEREEDSFDATWPLEDGGETTKGDNEVLEENIVAGEMSNENVISNDVVPEENVTVPDPHKLRKEKSFDAILPPELLKRCEAVASHSTGSFENIDGEDNDKARKSVPDATAVEKCLDLYDQVSFSEDKDKSQRNPSPAKVVWEGQYSTQDLEKLNVKYKNLNFIPSTQQLATDDNFFDADSADPFQRLSNANLFVKVQPQPSSKVKKAMPPRRNRLFGLEAESEEGTEDSASVESPKVLAKVKPKIKRKAFASSPAANEPEPKRGKRSSITTTKVVEQQDNIPQNVISQEKQNVELQKGDGTEKKKPENDERQQNHAEIVEQQKICDDTEKQKSENLVEQRKNDAPILEQPQNDEPQQIDVTMIEQEKSDGKENEKPESLAEQPKIDTPIAKEQKKEKKKYESPPPTYSNAHNVIFTNFHEQERKRYQEQVDAIRGNNLNETIEISYADIVVCDKLQRSEKLMIALAAGKYIVPSTYVVQSNRAGKWLPREEYEYGNPKSARKRVELSNAKDPDVAKKILESCYRLRYKAESLQHGAFHGWKVLIFDQSPNSTSICRIIEGGGGEAKLFSDVMHKDFKNFTMAIIAQKSAGLFTDTERSILNQYKIPYYTDQVVSNYLLTPNTEDALKRSWHAEYRRFMQGKKK